MSAARTRSIPRSAAAPGLDSTDAASDVLKPNASRAAVDGDASATTTSTAASHPKQTLPDLPAPQNARQHAPRHGKSPSIGPSSGAHSLAVSRSPSAAATPRSSREASPAGPSFRQSSTSTSSTNSRDMRSRKNSHDASPQRPPSLNNPKDVPSAAALQRALSSQAPQFHHNSSSSVEANSRLPRSQVPGGSEAGKERQWSMSPRLMSPPPGNGPRRSSLRNTRRPDDLITPNITLQRATPDPSPDPPRKETDAVSCKSVNAGRATSGAPTLETVQESSSNPATPDDQGTGTSSSRQSSQERSHQYFSFTSDDDPDRPNTAVQSSSNVTNARAPKVAESSTLGPSKPSKVEAALDPGSTPKAKMASKRSLTALRARTAAQPAVENMTVETETVTSIPQGPMAGPSDRVGLARDPGSGTLRVKRSNETIRPKKERKKASRKAPSIHNASKEHIRYERSQSTPVMVPVQLLGSAWQIPYNDAVSPQTSPKFAGFNALRVLHRMYSSTNLRTREASTRAEIFEDRVKTTMDEDSGDDSDETFVYESNPTEPPPRRSRHHSRSPSGASLASQDNRNIMRSIGNALDPQRPVPKTRSMKFASNNSNYGTTDDDFDGQNGGTLRARLHNVSGTVQHHHIGRGSRQATGQSILDEDNPLFPLSKTRSLTAVGGRASPAARAATSQLRNMSNANRRKDGYKTFDLEAEGADDERTPLMGTGTVRSLRNSNRTPRNRYRYYDPRQPRREQRSLLARFAGCLLIVFTLLVLGFGVICFMFAMSKPLMDVTVESIESVIASEQEIMLDLVVSATNPNLVPITISEMDVNLFARSKYVGSQRWWREHGPYPEPEPRPEPIKSDPRNLRNRRVGSITVNSTGFGHGDLIIAYPPPAPEVDDDAGSNKQTMLLGQIHKFDNPLSFDGSFWKRKSHFSTGSIRLSKPGNHTEAGGTERWERVLKHDFELVLRGVLRYNIPLGGRSVSVPINGETPVEGNGDKDKKKGDGSPEDDGDGARNPD